MARRRDQFSNVKTRNIDGIFLKYFQKFTAKECSRLRRTSSLFVDYQGEIVRLGINICQIYQINF